jgi:hypothetical protein
MIENEKQLFQLLKSRLIPDLESTDMYNPKDAVSSKYGMAIELKCRKKHYEYLILEKFKYDKLIKYDKARYIVSTPYGIYSFNLKKIEPEWIEAMLPATTEFENSNWIKKKVAYLNISEAKNISFIRY